MLLYYVRLQEGRIDWTDMTRCSHHTAASHGQLSRLVHVRCTQVDLKMEYPKFPWCIITSHIEDAILGNSPFLGNPKYHCTWYKNPITSDSGEIPVFGRFEKNIKNISLIKSRLKPHWTKPRPSDTKDALRVSRSRGPCHCTNARRFFYRDGEWRWWYVNGKMRVTHFRTPPVWFNIWFNMY